MGSTLLAKERKEFTKSKLHGMRLQGDIPAVIYGGKIESTPIAVSVKSLKKTISDVGKNGIIQLKLNGQQENVMMKEYQYDSLKNEYIHVDFLAVNLSEDVTSNVQLKLVGTPKGVKEGGTLQQALYEVAVTAKPKDLPESIEVNVTDLQIGETLTIGNIKSNASIEINHEEDEVIASVLAPKLEAEEEATESVDE
ncbi:50S ribosomal protein L25/general stress protein Ctc [Bacillus sp. JJ722]|uniref:50S ribosomal protein L25/general stress protein Ctc n=1 Tax=Bacillus sp. JJ722 TaxID=3122973 RepID=UPI002FFE7F0E